VSDVVDVIPPPGPHGGDAPRIARALGVAPSSLLDLSASLNPVAPDVAALLGSRLEAVRRYPDATEAHHHLAAAVGVDVECLLLTNGGAEAIALVAEEIGGQVREPEFSLHPRGEETAPLWRSNPHNPSGQLAGAEEHADVWDEAFFPLATGQWTRGDTSALAVVGSLTKVFACPGLRLGYVIAEPSLVERLRARQPSWSVGSLALAVLPDLLAMAELARWRDEIALLRQQLVHLLRSHGLSPLDSDANFVLCGGAGSLRNELIVEGIVVRDCASFGMPDHVRIAVPDSNGIERLSRALGRVLC
jgi:histidinol-phosphate/aromatic aminotransferase/cobyric acid decarboxylase-like protein